MLEKIIVRFGDNDFSWLMLEFGHLLLRFEKYSRRRFWTDDFSKQEIVDFFNGISNYFYHFYTGEKVAPRLGNYLKIEDKHVFINNEVDKVLETYDQWGNGDSVLVDYWNETVTIL